MMFNVRETNMLTHDQVAILRDISQSIAFADDRHGQVEQLIIEGYVMKAGDLYELTSKGLIPTALMIDCSPCSCGD